jgi:hypothetical protein
VRRIAASEVRRMCCSTWPKRWPMSSSMRHDDPTHTLVGTLTRASEAVFTGW